MKLHLSAQALLVVAIVLLALNLVLMLGVHVASPAHADDLTLVGVATACNPQSGEWVLYKGWSSGRVDRYTSSVPPY